MYRGPLGRFKLNFDGSYDYFNNSAGIGGIVRDPYGNMLSSFAGEVSASRPLEAELLALHKGLEVCKGLEISLLQIEGDSPVLGVTLQQAANMEWDLMAAWRKTMELLQEIS